MQSFYNKVQTYGYTKTQEDQIRLCQETCNTACIVIKNKIK